MTNLDFLLDSYGRQPKRSKWPLLLIAGGLAMWYGVKNPEVIEKNYPQLVYELMPPDTIETLVHDTVTVMEPWKMGDYLIVLTDAEIANPFVATKELYDKVNDVTRGQEDKAKALYDWIEKIDYREQDKTPYRRADQTFSQGEGLCAELAYLYIVSARLVGMDAHYVRVEVDYDGKKVNHGCASIKYEGEKILVDPAYHSFDAKHKVFEEINDAEASKLFKQWSR